ncbi:MAG: OmpA family protein [Myxococcota bacterium]|nr:OmpA family protein [Myxococcota bacterium]
MASVIALRAILGASLGLGTLDLVWINLAGAPQLIAGGVAPAPMSAPAPAAVTTAVAAVPDPAIVMEPAPAVEAAPAPIVVAPREPAKPVAEQVYFPSMSAVLDAAGREVLDAIVAQAAQAGADAVIVLQGHADHRGDERYNRQLSKQRALATARYLTARGIPHAGLRIGFVGEDHASAGSELWRDRRVDIQVTGGAE